MAQRSQADGFVLYACGNVFISPDCAPLLRINDGPCPRSLTLRLTSFLPPQLLVGGDLLNSFYLGLTNSLLGSLL